MSQREHIQRASLPETADETRKWFDGWVRLMIDLENRPPEVVASARPKKMLPSGKPSRTKIWLQAKAARLQEATKDRPVLRPWRPSEPQLEPGRFYEPAEPQKSTEDQLRYAVRAYGRTGGARAHWYLGSKLFEAIPTLGDGWHWAWLCQQHVERLPWIADRLDQRLGRRTRPPEEPAPLIKDTTGGGQYMRNLTQVAPRLEPAHNARAILCSELKGRVAGYDYWVDELTHLRLTCADWRRIVGHALKKQEKGQMEYSLKTYLKQAAWQQAQMYSGKKDGPQASLERRGQTC